MDGQTERIECESLIDSGERGRPHANAHTVHTMERLAPCLIDGACRTTSTRLAKRILETEFVYRRPILRSQVHQTPHRIRGAGAPVRSSACARQRYRFLHPRRSEKAFVAHA